MWILEPLQLLDLVVVNGAIMLMLSTDLNLSLVKLSEMPPKGRHIGSPSKDHFVTVETLSMPCPHVM